MTEKDHDRFAAVAEQVIRELRGDPNPSLSSSREKRWGNGGSLSLEVETGQVYDHEQGEGGGIVWFCSAETGLPAGEAVKWMIDRGFVKDQPGDGHQPEPKRSSPYPDRPAHPRTPPPAERTPEPPPLPADDPGPAPPPPSGPPASSPGGPRTDAAGNWIPKNLPDTAYLSATFDYCDEAGEVAYQVCRYDYPDPASAKGHGKHFLQRIPDKSKPHGYAYKTRGMRWLPYRLPELLDDVRDGVPIFIVEGEKKVDMLREIGVPATCNHGGAGKFPETLVEHFKGAKVCILPDNDKAGQDHATLIGRRLRAIAEEVLILDLPGLPPKGGVDDWLPAGGTAEALYRLRRDEARPFVPPPPVSKFGGVPWADLDKPGPQLERIIKGVLTANEISLLVGESQSGKSFLALDLAMCVARGQDFFGHKTRRGGVIYQAGESAVGVRRRRLPAYRQHHHVNGEDVPFVLLEHQIDLFGNPDQIDQLVEECIAWRDTFDVRLDLVVIDTFNRATPGANENDGRDMSIVLENAEKIRRETGAHVLMVHHLNAGGTRARGHTSLFANVDAVITVKKVEATKDPEGRQVREWTISKQKDGEDGVSQTFVLPAIEIGRDEDGDRITSCVVVRPGATEGPPRDGEPGAVGAGISGWNATALRAIYNALAECGQAAPVGLNLPASTRVVSRQDVGRELARAARADGIDGEDVKEGETPDQARERRDAARRAKAASARDALYSRGIIRMDENWIWLTGKRVQGFGPPPGSQRWAPPADADGDQTPGPDLPFDMGDFQ
ncbi:MAG: AAA family ATPase [Loktanella sp.]|nr:AAA family ATPase [Loktanella sp.]